MRSSFFLLLLLINGYAPHAQDYPKCSYHYFKNGKIATSECYDANNRFGKAKAFNKRGDVIYEKEIRKIAGHSYVQFSYYPDGAVQKAEWSSAPDGGIQWYSSMTYFSQDGTITEETENDYDNSPGKLLRYTQTKPPVITSKKPDTAKTIACAVIYSTEFWYINNIRRPVIITATRGQEQFNTVVHPKETQKGGQFILAEQFEDPLKYYHFTVAPKYANDKNHYTLKPAPGKPEQASKAVRRYYLEVVKEAAVK